MAAPSVRHLFDGIELAEQERRVRQMNEPARVPVHRVGRADHRQPRGQAGVVPYGGRRGLQSDGDVVRPGGPAERPLSPGHGVAVGIDAFGHDAYGRDADGQRHPGVCDQGVVRAHPTPAPAAGSALTGVRYQARPGQPAHALAHCRL